MAGLTLWELGNILRDRESGVLDKVGGIMTKQEEIREGIKRE